MNLLGTMLIYMWPYMETIYMSFKDLNQNKVLSKSTWFLKEGGGGLIHAPRS